MTVSTTTSTGQQTASISYEANTIGTPQYVRLSYTVTPQGGEPQHYDYQVRLVTTQPHFGGLRWWFMCPLRVNGHACGRRVSKLYLPPGGHYFGCRHCYRLTYTSSQDSRKPDHLARLLGVDPEVIRMLERHWARGY